MDYFALCKLFLPQSCNPDLHQARNKSFVETIIVIIIVIATPIAPMVVSTSGINTNLLKRITPREFPEDFWKYCHLGLFTSLPYLYESDGPLRAHHWKANTMQNRMPRGLGDLWLYKGPTYRFPQAYLEQVADKRQIVAENLKSTIYNYQC